MAQCLAKTAWMDEQEVAAWMGMRLPDEKLRESLVEKLPRGQHWGVGMKPLGSE